MVSWLSNFFNGEWCRESPFEELGIDAPRLMSETPHQNAGVETDFHVSLTLRSNQTGPFEICQTDFVTNNFHISTSHTGGLPFLITPERGRKEAAGAEKGITLK